jgi:hypothetical protein
MTRNATLWLILLLLIVSITGATTTSPEDSECERHYQAHAAAGQWHGTFWVEYEPSIERVSVPIKMRERWEILLDFNVVRASEGGIRVNDDDGVIHGTGHGEQKAQIRGNVRGQSFNEIEQSHRDIEFAIEGKEREPDFQFKKLELRRAPGQIGFSAKQEITGPDGRATGTMTGSESGDYTAHIHSERNGKVLDKNTSSKVASDASNGSSSKKVTWFELNAEHISCATMMGKIDRDVFEAKFKASGMTAHVVDSNWAATYNDRDLQFEQKVTEVMNRVPNPPSIKVLERLAQQFSELRGDPKSASDYHLCVLQPLMDKIIRSSVILMRQEAQRVDRLQISSLDDLKPELITIMSLYRIMQLMGAGECPLAKDLAQLIQKKAREKVKWILAHNPSVVNLLVINQLWSNGALDLGDQTGPFMNAWNQNGMSAKAGKAGP